MTTPASTRLANLPELLTAILSHLPYVQLLTTTRQVRKSRKLLVGTSPLLLWQTWSTESDTKAPWSITSSYSNKNCQCTGHSSLGRSDRNWRCENHVYTDTFKLNPLALHFLEIAWKKLMRTGPEMRGDGLSEPFYSNCDRLLPLKRPHSSTTSSRAFKPPTEAPRRWEQRPEAGKDPEIHPGAPFQPSNALVRPFNKDNRRKRYAESADVFIAGLNFPIRHPPRPKHRGLPLPAEHPAKMLLQICMYPADLRKEKARRAGSDPSIDLNDDLFTLVIVVSGRKDKKKPRKVTMEETVKVEKALERRVKAYTRVDFGYENRLGLEDPELKIMMELVEPYRIVKVVARKVLMVYLGDSRWISVYMDDLDGS
ncbi:hypothetical protein ABW19_dt0205579 [Dactylella cylindrospora]|nr:hypothetical protein ABW19_dt0205579 [Dactylella cylindrospora]